MDREKRRAAGEQVSEDEEEEEEGGQGEAKPREPPKQPVFNQQAALERFDEKEENAIVEIPNEIIDDIDDDWPMTQEEETEFIDRALASREGV